MVWLVSFHLVDELWCGCEKRYFSLIAMSTLYVLDWHRRTLGSHRYPSNLLFTTPVPNSENGSSTAADEGWMGNVIGNKAFEPPRYENGPPLTACCGHQHCRTYCCSNIEKADAEVGDLKV